MTLTSKIVILTKPLQVFLLTNSIKTVIVKV